MCDKRDWQLNVREEVNSNILSFPKFLTDFVMDGMFEVKFLDRQRFPEFNTEVLQF